MPLVVKPAEGSRTEHYPELGTGPVDYNDSMGNRDPAVFPGPHQIDLARTGNRHHSFGLPAAFTPGPRLGEGLDKTIQALQQACDEQRLAEPVTVRKARAVIAGG